jgi:hypothetical protein
MTDAPIQSEEAAAAEFLLQLGFGFDPATGQMTMPESALENIRRVVNADTVEGYALYYFLVMNKPAPKHVLGWIEKIHEYTQAKFPVLMEAFAGSTKTTAITQIWASWQIGKHPEGAGLIVQASDATASNNAESISVIIESNPAWKLCFPHVVPDKDRGWGADGYFVKRSDMDYGEFSRLRVEKKDPTFVGYGYASTTIVGMHPNLFLIVDDIHDEENTRSAREIDHVKTKFAGTISSRRTPHEPPMIVCFTPWNDDDVYAAAKQTGAYKHIFTPGRKEDGSPTWPEMLGEETLQKKLAEDVTGGIQFARMVMLDLKKQANRVFVYQEYPDYLIKRHWPMVGGVDYAGVVDPTKRSSYHSHFALAFLAKLPEGGAVVYDGVLEQCSQGESEAYLIKAQSQFENWLIAVIEGDGKGEEFFQLCIRNPGLRVEMMKTGGKSKAERLVKQVGPWLRSGRLRLSSGNSKFLNAARKFLDNYPAVGEHDPGWDVWDSIYWGCRRLPDVLAMPNPERDAARVFRQRQHHSNPLVGIGSVHA